MSFTLHANQDRHVLVTDPTERQQAREVLQVLDGRPERLAVEVDAAAEVLPAELAAILSKVLEAMASGKAVTIGTLPDELTTTVAAAQLGVSRPTLMKMINSGELDSRQVGSHHRVKAVDVLHLKRTRLAQQRQAFDELRSLEDQLEQF
jgi:excisionase family DNA binding protein